MSRVERVEHMLQAIEYETSLVFNEHTVLLNKNQELEAENTKLRKELNHWRVEQTHAYSNWQDAYERAKKCEDENAKLREQLEYDRQTSRSRLERIDHLKAENAKLRNELDQWERLTANIELPEYPITEFKPKDLERENHKLRELAKRMYAAFRRVFPDGHRLDFEQDMRELGIEVG